MSNKLKIYACSGIGATEQKTLTFFTDGTNTLANTKAVNSLLCKINASYIRATRLPGISKEEKISLLCDVDLLSVCLDAAKQFQDNTEQLHHAGEVIGVMCDNHEFEFYELDPRKREDHLDELIAIANEGYRDMTPIANPNAEFIAWWQENVEAFNTVGLNFGQQQNARKAMKKAADTIKGIKGIGKIDPNWQDNPEISNYLLNGGTYFLYTFFTDEQLAKLPAVFKRKKDDQMKTYNYCKSFFVGELYGTEEDMRSIIRSSCIAEFEQDPDEICAAIASGKRKGVSGPLLTFILKIGVKNFIALVAIIAGTIAAIVLAICTTIYKTSKNKYGTVDRNIVNGSVPEGEDFDDVDLGQNDPRTQSSSFTPLIIVGVLAALKYL